MNEDALARDIISKHAYRKFVENKKLMLAWLLHVPTGGKRNDVPNDEWVPVLFFLRRSCYNTVFNVAYTWIGHDAFAKHMHRFIGSYMAKNDMIDLSVYSERYPHSPL